MKRLAVLAALLWLALAVTGADAHPLGNFSISHYTALEIGAAEVTVRYVIDMAEIPTFQEIQDTGLVAEAGHASVAPWSAAKATALARGLRLSVGERPLTLGVVSHETIFPPGAGGLPTLKLGVVYRAPLPKDGDGTLELRYRDENFAERAGWKEIIARPAPGVTLLVSSAPATDRSRELSDYPTDLLNSPPQDVEARVSFTRAAGTVAAASAPPAPPMALRPNVQSSGSNAFADLVARSEPGLGLLALALATAAVLGAFHALEPGHGKTVVAAYLVGARGTAWHAVILGLVVTISHTAGVYLLGAVTFYASKHVVPEQLYPWLSLVSGLTIAVLGAVMFMRRFGGVQDHHHGPGGHHHHHGLGSHTHSHDGLPEHSHVPGEVHDHGSQPVSLRALVALGVSGGIIPCPAALVVLLTALSMHRVGFGLVLIVAFSVGLAAVLVAIGVLMVYAGRLMTRFKEDGPLIRRWLPLTSSAVMTLLGFGIAIQAVVPWIRR
ncbi:MAG TPA: high-affinity nickel-transporter [Methylomirabilota bacterium]|nr:high-affinity nickel-transporter [Methylomirabilota bacterium]